MKSKLSLFVITVLLLLSFPIPARADGIIIPEPPPCDPCPPPPCPGPFPCPIPSPMKQLAIRYHHVTVTIEDQVAITHVDQVFYNPNDWTVEGSYIFPLPPEAAVNAFTLWVDGQAVEGQILDAEQARQQYQEIVNSLQDPALLEYVGNDAVQAHVFPIPPQGERRIELEYTQALNADNGLVRYIYPLSTEKFSLWPLEEVSVSVDVRASTPIRAVYSPSHPVAINRESETHIRAGYEDSHVLPDTDFALYYSLGENEAFHLISYRDPGDSSDPDGFFMLLLAPRPDAAQQKLSKDVLLVLDRSGSMDGEKFRQAQDALRYILEHLNDEDRFNIIAFSTGMESYASQLRPASEAAEAVAWVERLSAEGSTDINRALLEAAAIADRERPTYLIFLTDGLPTEGVVDSQKILDNLQATATDNLRLFAFGVGYDVDTFLLDSLAQAHHGTSTYVLPDERLDETLSAFYAKVSTPVLTDLTLDFGDLSVYDLYPSPLPDLFSGSQIIAVGRYRQGGATDVTLKGEINNQPQTFHFPEITFTRESPTSSQDPRAAIPRLWATRKIGHLLNQIRLKGPDQETIDQIVHLSIRYGIITPYTSYLVTEPLPLGAAEQERIAEEQFDQEIANPPAAVYGQEAVEKAAEQGSMAEAEAPAAPAEGAANIVRYAGSRTFVLNEGAWIDTSFDPGAMQTTELPFLSAEYFAIINAHPELGGAFALGQSVIVVLDGAAYQVIPAENNLQPSEIRPSRTPPAATTPIAAAPLNSPTAPTEKTATQAVQTPAPAASNQPAAAPCLGGLLPGLLLALAWLVKRLLAQ